MDRSVLMIILVVICKEVKHLFVGKVDKQVLVLEEYSSLWW